MATETSFEDLCELLDRLDGEPADALESQSVEFKSWDAARSSARDQLRRLRESVVAFANASGGWLVLGVADRCTSKQDAIHGVGDLSVDRLRVEIYEGTDPSILVDHREIATSFGRLIALRVPPGIPPHTTSAGVARIRVGKHNMPLTGLAIQQLISASGQLDRTALVIPDAKPTDLDQAEIRRLRETIGRQNPESELLSLDDKTLLSNLDLTSDRGVSLAALLLLGTTQALARFAPSHELILLRRKDDTSYDLRRDLRRPILAMLDELDQWLGPQQELTIVEQSGFEHREIPSLSRLSVREALLNALVHRDHFISAATHVDLYPDRLEITSPGGFIGGVTPDNVLRHQPVRRNPLLANTLLTISLVNRASIGVDRIYEELLRGGKDLPRYNTNGLQVRLSLPTRTNPDMVRLLDDQLRSGIQMSLDELICLRGVTRYGSLERGAAASLLQIADPAAAAAPLMSLRRQGLLQPIGRGPHTTYRLAAPYLHLSDTESDRLSDPLADADLARERVLFALRTERRLNNADVRELTGYSRTRARRLMSDLRDAGLVELRGQGRAAHYVPILDADHAPTPSDPDDNTPPEMR